jgi:hypothetical protein
LDETLVKQLSIDENNTWFEEIPMPDGILLKICRNAATFSGEESRSSS